MKVLTSIKLVFSNMLTKNLPDRTKRLMFLASLSPSLVGTALRDRTTISKLNEVMALSSTDRALDFPIQLSKVIWKSDSGTVTLYPGQAKPEVEGLVERLLDAAPKWLRYSDREQMHEDLSKLIANRALLSS